jgi:hypothetical protein
LGSFLFNRKIEVEDKILLGREGIRGFFELVSSPLFNIFCSWNIFLNYSLIASFPREENSQTGAEFKTRGTRSQIPEKLGHVPEFGARLQIHDREK